MLLLPIRVNAEEILKINKKNILNLRLTFNKQDKKNLIIISYKLIINSDKYYINEKINTKSSIFTNKIFNYILNYWNHRIRLIINILSLIFISIIIRDRFG